MSNDHTPKAIDSAIAKRFLQDPDSFNLSEATSITDEAAELLSEHDGGLGLDGLMELSDAAAESLSKHEGEFLYLDGLTELSDAAVDSLSKHPGQLTLNGLTELSDAAAESLSKHQGEFLYLDGLTELSDAGAETLSKHQGDLLLNGLTELSDAAIESLSKHRKKLYLNGLTELSDAAAESLSTHQGGLILDGLTELSDAAIESLSKVQGDLSLDGLTELSDAAAKSLSKHRKKLYLNGLTELSDAAAESLSTHQGDLILDGLTELSDAAAESLSKHRGKLCLKSLQTVSAKWLPYFIESMRTWDRNDLEAFYAAAANDDEFIVQIAFDYCDVNYSGYEILSKAELGKLIAGLRSGVRVGTRNMPGSWYEDFDIGLLEGSFSIHSANPDDIAAMRSVFGESVGDTGYFYDVMEAAPNIIDLALAQEFLKDDSIDLSEMTSITDEAAELLSTQKGGVLELDGLAAINPEVAFCLASREGGLSLQGLEEIDVETARALATHQDYDDDDGCRYGLYLNLQRIPQQVIDILSRKNGTINDMPAPEYFT